MKTPHPAESAPPLELRGHVVRKLSSARGTHTYSVLREATAPDGRAHLVYVTIHAPTCTLDPDDYIRMTVHTLDGDPDRHSVYHHFPADTRITTRRRRSS